MSNEQGALAADRLEHAVADRDVEVFVGRAVGRLEGVRRCVGVRDREVVQVLDLPPFPRYAGRRAEVRDDRLAERDRADRVGIGGRLVAWREPPLEPGAAHVRPHPVEGRGSA